MSESNYDENNNVATLELEIENNEVNYNTSKIQMLNNINTESSEIKAFLPKLLQSILDPINKLIHNADHTSHSSSHGNNHSDHSNHNQSC